MVYRIKKRQQQYIYISDMRPHFHILLRTTSIIGSVQCNSSENVFTQIYWKLRVRILCFFFFICILHCQLSNTMNTHLGNFYMFWRPNKIRLRWSSTIKTSEIHYYIYMYEEKATPASKTMSNNNDNRKTSKFRHRVYATGTKRGLLDPDERKGEKKTATSNK